MNSAIEIPDNVARRLASSADGVPRAVLEAVAVEAYRSGAITASQVQETLGLPTRWDTEALLRSVDAYHNYTMDDLDRDLAANRDAAGR